MKKDWIEIALIALFVGLLTVWMLEVNASSYDYDGGVSLHTEIYPVGRTVNREYTIIYWIVEYSGKDYEGNWHRWREEVSTRSEVGELGVAKIAADQLVDKLKAGDEQAHGFMRAVSNGQDEVLL